MLSQMGRGASRGIERAENPYSVRYEEMAIESCSGGYYQGTVLVRGISRPNTMCSSSSIPGIAQHIARFASLPARSTPYLLYRVPVRVYQAFFIRPELQPTRTRATPTR